MNDLCMYLGLTILNMQIYDNTEAPNTLDPN
jgi:hypothetical protein